MMGYVLVCLSLHWKMYILITINRWQPASAMMTACSTCGFWYRRNLRSPKEAPSFHTSDSWIVSEDRLSAPLTGIFCEKKQRFMTVNRLDQFANSTLATHREGEIILSDKTSLGYTGFENKGGVATLSFGFPYREAPKSYIRKLTLAPAVTAYQLLKKEKLFC